MFTCGSKFVSGGSRKATVAKSVLSGDTQEGEESISMDFQVCQSQKNRVLCHLKCICKIHSKLFVSELSAIGRDYSFVTNKSIQNCGI